MMNKCIRKQFLSVLCCLFLLCSVSCSQTDTYEHSTEGAQYVMLDQASHWKPIGKISQNKIKGATAAEKEKNFYCYDNDPEHLFLIEDNALLFESLIYHKADITFPDYKEATNIIITQSDGTNVELEQKAVQILLNSISDPDKMIVTDRGEDIGFASLYFKDFPAYLKDMLMLYKFKNGTYGLSFSATEKNIALLGGADNKIQLVLNGN